MVLPFSAPKLDTLEAEEYTVKIVNFTLSFGTSYAHMHELLLVCLFEEKARPLQWLVFVVSSTRSVHFFVVSFVQLLGREFNTDLSSDIAFQSSDVTFSSSNVAYSKFEYNVFKVRHRPESLTD